eukprot:TRINITY_DN2829_c0_g1_i3.p1 TRINITY_DN2829_c0_g1~~TRINITY_DN2829_c0_g1_i3.p1  ORF type:complete len:320 (-),score=36.70 TRINITY_DN2829_c0_g1_i3:126-1085(-)
MASTTTITTTARSISTTINRILVHFSEGGHKQASAPPTPVHFSQCLLELCQQKIKEENGRNEVPQTTYIDCHLQDTKLIISKSCKERGVLLKHPPFCPVLHISQEELLIVPPDIVTRGVDVGVVALIQSADNKVLLTRRAAHMRTFPSTWVPPGGHIEPGETLAEALAREVFEETGINIDGRKEKLVCAWESVYPYILSMGLPKRHHIVLYYLIKLEKTHSELADDMKLDENEVDGAGWLDHTLAKVIAGGEPQIPGTNFPNQTLTIQNFCKLTKCWKVCDIPYSVFLTEAPSSGPDLERVSTGTRFALQEWLKLTPES